MLISTITVHHHSKRIVRSILFTCFNWSFHFWCSLVTNSRPIISWFSWYAHVFSAFDRDDSSITLAKKGGKVKIDKHHPWYPWYPRYPRYRSSQIFSGRCWPCPRSFRQLQPCCLCWWKVKSSSICRMNSQHLGGFTSQLVRTSGSPKNPLGKDLGG